MESTLVIVNVTLLNFEREQMDENILEDISPSLLRTLGLREGDIIRVMKYLDASLIVRKHQKHHNRMVVCLLIRMVI